MARCEDGGKRAQGVGGPERLHGAEVIGIELVESCHPEQAHVHDQLLLQDLERADQTVFLLRGGVPAGGVGVSGLRAARGVLGVAVSVAVLADPVTIRLYPFGDGITPGPREGARGQPSVRTAVRAAATARHDPCSPTGPCARSRARARSTSAASRSRRCSTYLVLGNEMDSPRGRIYLIRAAAEGRGSISQSFVQHMNLCLMCRACETACPSGVKFGFLMEAARGQVDRPGVYNLLHPELAQQFLDRKIERIKETGAEVVVSGNPGCSLQIEKGLKERGLDIRVVHPVELLDWSYRGTER